MLFRNRSIGRPGVLSCLLAAVAACSSNSARPPGGGGGAAASTGGSGATQTGGATASGGSAAGGNAAGGAAAATGGAGGMGGQVGVAAPSLLLQVTDKFPAGDATGICADTQLRLTFTVPVAVGKGMINVWSASAPSAPVDTIDAGALITADMIGGRRFGQNRPIFIDGMQVTVYLHRGKLVPNETYYVTVDSEVFTSPAGASLGHIAGNTEWRFTTRAAAPASASNLVVSLDNTGDFCSVQSAIDAIPTGNTTPVTVNIKNGTYREIVFISSRHNVTLHGEDRKKTIIAYANNNTLNNGTAARAMVEVEQSNDLVVENLTLHNLTPQGGSQAEAIRIEPGDRAILRNADFLSLQDTLLLSGRVYLYNCYVEGNVDFIWGKGTAYFEKCEIKTVGRKGFNVQARNLSSQYGYVFVDSKMTADPGITGHFLARVDGVAYPYSHVAYINCELGSHIDPVGWVFTNTVDSSHIRYWEYKSVDPTGAPIDVSQRFAASKQLTDAEAAMMRDKATVFGGTPAWVPMP